MASRAHLTALFLIFVALPASAANLVVRGQVLLSDGAPPGKAITIERICNGTGGTGRPVAVAAKDGRFLYTMDADAMRSETCYLRGRHSEYDSTAVPVSHLNSWSDPVIPAIVLSPRDSSAAAQDFGLLFANNSIPPNARQPWNNAIKAIKDGNWVSAERQLRDVVREAPKYADGWLQFGSVLIRLNKFAEAKPALESALHLNPKLVSARVSLLRVNMELKDLAAAERLVDDFVKSEEDQKYPEVHAYLALARHSTGNLSGAEASAREAIRLDRKGELAQTEVVLASILEAKEDYAGAREHLNRYLELEPRAADAAAVRGRIVELENPQPVARAAPIVMAAVPVDATGEAWVPGGMKALAIAAHMKGEPSYRTFFADYCRAIGMEVSSGTGQGFARYPANIQGFLSTVSRLAEFGEKRDDSLVIKLSAAKPSWDATEKVVRLLGWILTREDGVVRAEPGHKAEDSIPQNVAGALGIDLIAMEQALESESEFVIEILSENARLVGGDMWRDIVNTDRIPPGGLAAVFAADPRIAKTCAGLNSMDVTTASALISKVGLKNLAQNNAEALYRYSGVMALEGIGARVPGGSNAENAWQRLAGSKPSDGVSFLNDVLNKDTGRLAAFFFTMANSDAAHREYFTKTPERLQRAYEWFRGSPEVRNGIVVHKPGWTSDILQSAPLSGGNIRYPGGPAVWGADGQEVRWDRKSLEALVPVAQLEQKRGVPLTEEAVTLLVRNHKQWRALYPYFEILPRLGASEFSALEAFAKSVQKRKPQDRNIVLGEWYALLELVARGVRAGTIDATAANSAFTRFSTSLAEEAYTQGARESLRGIGGTNPASLLGFDTARKESYDRVLDLMHVPDASQADNAAFASALDGMIYAATLNPNLLVVNEDPGLLARHEFDHIEDGEFVFAPATILRPSGGHAARFSGGFAGFENAAGKLLDGAKAPPRRPAAARPSTETAAAAPGTGASDGTDANIKPDFTSDGRLVEVWATVTGGRGRFLDDLKPEQFSILDGGKPQALVAFEPQSSALSCVLLLDLTGSMADTLPALKKAALRLIDALRPGDSVAVFGFSETVTELVPFTTDHQAARKAILAASVFGDTALYDAVTRMGHELTGRTGKKVIVVFTDGADTASMLPAETAIDRAKFAGVPIFTIAQGGAANNKEVLKQLATISDSTGGVSFPIKDPSEMDQVFEKVAEYLTHGYLLYFQPPPVEEGKEGLARELKVEVKGAGGTKVLAKEEYYP